MKRIKSETLVLSKWRYTSIWDKIGGGAGAGAAGAGAGLVRHIGAGGKGAGAAGLGH